MSLSLAYATRCAITKVIEAHVAGVYLHIHILYRNIYIYIYILHTHPGYIYCTAPDAVIKKRAKLAELLHVDQLRRDVTSAALAIDLAHKWEKPPPPQLVTCLSVGQLDSLLVCCLVNPMSTSSWVESSRVATAFPLTEPLVWSRLPVLELPPYTLLCPARPYAALATLPCSRHESCSASVKSSRDFWFNGARWMSPPDTNFRRLYKPHCSILYSPRYKSNISLCFFVHFYVLYFVIHF